MANNLHSFSVSNLNFSVIIMPKTIACSILMLKLAFHMLLMLYVTSWRILVSISTNTSIALNILTTGDRDIALSLDYEYHWGVLLLVSMPYTWQYTIIRILKVIVIRSLTLDSIFH